MDQYEWDEAKNQANRAKHGIGFELIYEFDWSTASFRPDTRFDYGEERNIAYGRIRGRGYAVVYVERNDRVRVISLRPAHEQEMQRYEKS
ncbi:MAG: BrnT family toxin [Devosia sp.]